MAAIPPPAHILARIVSPDDMMERGLELGGFSDRQINDAGLKLKYSRFKSWFGSHPVVYAQIWEDLLTTDIAEARIELDLVCRGSLDLVCRVSNDVS
jgi:hypothetical protein